MQIAKIGKVQNVQSLRAPGEEPETSSQLSRTSALAPSSLEKVSDRLDHSSVVLKLNSDLGLS